MIDISHEWGEDLRLSASGDLLTSAQHETTRQKLVRRLLTNPGDDLWNLEFGLGLGYYVGRTIDVREIEAKVRSQLSREPNVAAIPPARVEVESDGVEPGGRCVLRISYVDKSTGSAKTATLSLGN
jgi:hypothetical protein